MSRSFFDTKPDPRRSEVLELTQLAPLPAAQSTFVLHSRRGLPRKWRLMLPLIVVVVPTVLAAIYYYLIASDRYVSQTSLVIRGEGQTNSFLQSLLGAGFGGGSALADNTNILYEYIRSREMMQKMNEIYDLRNIYSDPMIDFVTRLRSNADSEALYDHYRDMVDVTLEPSNRIVTVRLRAFEPNQARNMLRTLISLAEQRINNMLDQRRSDSINFARGEVTRAEHRLGAARNAVAAFRRKYGDLDPEQSAQAVGGIVAGLQKELADTRTELKSRLVFLRPESPQIVALRSKIAALTEEIGRARVRVSSDDSGEIPARIEKYESLLLEQEFAQAAYRAARGFLETARADAQRKHSYVVDFIPPNLPDVATEPERIKGVITVFLLSVILYAVLSLILTAIREQARL